MIGDEKPRFGRLYLRRHLAPSPMEARLEDAFSEENRSAVAIYSSLRRSTSSVVGRIFSISRPSPRFMNMNTRSFARATMT